MRKAFGIFLIIIGFVTIYRVGDFGKEFYGTLGELIGVTIVCFLPAYFLLRVSKDAKSEVTEHKTMLEISKIVLAVVLTIIGVFAIIYYSDYSKHNFEIDSTQTIVTTIGLILITFLPAYLLVKYPKEKANKREQISIEAPEQEFEKMTEENNYNKKINLQTQFFKMGKIKALKNKWVQIENTALDLNSFKSISKGRFGRNESPEGYAYYIEVVEREKRDDGTTNKYMLTTYTQSEEKMCDEDYLILISSLNS